MSRSIPIVFLVAAGLLVSSGCGGGGKKKSEPKPVEWKTVSAIGVSMKVPADFDKQGGGDAIQYSYKAGLALIGIETGTFDEEEGLEYVYKKEYEKRQSDTRKARKNEEAYKIIRKEDITFGGKKAFEIEQEYLSGAGDVKAHDITVCVDLGGGKLLTIFWRVTDIADKSTPWDRMYNRYFKESRASAKLGQ